MIYEGTEVIKLPFGVSFNEVQNVITAWLRTSVGKKYRIRESRHSFICLMRTWYSSWVWLLCCLGIIPGLIYMLCFPDYIRIKVLMDNQAIRLDLVSTNKYEAEVDFDSLIRAIQNAISAKAGFDSL